MTTLCKRFICSSTKPFNCFDSPVCNRCFILLKSKELTLKVLVIEAVIDNNTLAALTLLIAESNPKEKEVIIDLVMNFLNNDDYLKE